MAKSISKFTFSGGITTLRVGPKKAVFHVHSNLLASCSTYFAELLSRQQHQDGGFVFLESENPNIIHLFLNWIYHGKVFGTSFAESTPDWQDLIHLWLLAERVQVPALQEDVISHCYAKSRPSNLNNNNNDFHRSVCPVDMIEYAFNHTSHGSQLRQVIAEVWVENAGRVRNSDNLIHKLPKEFLQDLCFIFLQKTREKEANKTLDVPKESTKEDVKAMEEGDLQEPKNVNLKEEKKSTEGRPNEEKLREEKSGEEIPMEHGKKELKGEEILEEYERPSEQKLNEKPSKEKKGKEDKKAKEKEFRLATPISPHVNIDQAEKIPVMEETVPTVPVTEASEQRSDVSVVRNGDGIREEEIAFISPQELPSDANKQIADSSNDAVSPQTSKKKKQKKNKATLNGTHVSATSPIPQENSLIETGGDDDEVSVNNVVSPAVNGKRYKQGPMADSEQAWLPREWTGAEATNGDSSSPVNDGLASSKASSFQKNSKHKNKNSGSFQNGHSPFPPKGPRADISRQNSSSSTFQGFGNNARYHNDGYQKKPHGEKGHMGRNNRSRPVYSPGNDPRNERKQKTTSFLDPALQSSLQQIRKSDQKGTDFKKGKARN